MVDRDDDTPADRAPIARNQAHQGLVRALHHHAIGLTQVLRSVREIRDGIATAERTAPDEIERLARVFRDESDTAVEVARQAEALARAGGQG